MLLTNCVHSTTIQQQSKTNTLICQSSNIIALTLKVRVLLVYRTPGRPITTHTIISIHG